jgi:hypothetical protein
LPPAGPAEVISNKIASGEEYVIVSQKEWHKILDINPNLTPPLLKSEGKAQRAMRHWSCLKGEALFISGSNHQKT